MKPESLVTARRGPTGALGSLVLAGRRTGSIGQPGRRTVRFPSFGLTFVLRGKGFYRDERHEIPLGPGSVVFVFPGHPHWYGATQKPGWDELFLVFDGPVFRLAHDSGLHTSDMPVFTLTPIEPWRRRIERFRSHPVASTALTRDSEACEILKLVVDIRARCGPSLASGTTGTDWYSVSCKLLEGDLERATTLQQFAAAVGMQYETWRRYFRRRSGYSPAQYRLIHRLEAAATMLDETSLTSREIAAALGFSDEQHFVRHFKASFGRTPRQYRTRHA